MTYNTSLLLLAASPILTATVCKFVLGHMVAQLAASTVDLSRDEEAAAYLLKTRGYSSTTVAALLARAQPLAAAERRKAASN